MSSGPLGTEDDLWNHDLRASQRITGPMQKLKWYSLAFMVWFFLSMPWIALTWVFT